jgi:excisionase family DNA binding protein
MVMASKDNPSPQSESRFLSVKEAAQYLGMSERFVWDRRFDGSLVPFKFGKSVRFDRSELDRYAQDCRDEPSGLLGRAS